MGANNQKHYSRTLKTVVTSHNFPQLSPPSLNSGDLQGEKGLEHLGAEAAAIIDASLANGEVDAPVQGLPDEKELQGGEDGIGVGAGDCLGSNE